MRRFATLTLFCTFFSYGCEGELDDVIPCTADYDCPAGQTCNIEDALNGLCEDAVAGSEKNFGQIELDFTEGSEVYMLSVYDIPTEAEVSADYVSFELSGAGSGNALRLNSRSNAYEMDPTEAQRWQSRFAHEQLRHEGIERRVQALRAGAEVGRYVPGLLRNNCGECGNTQMCWQGSCTDIVSVAMGNGGIVNGTLVDVVSSGDLSVNVVLDNADSTTQTQSDVLSAANDFLSTLQSELNILGKTSYDTDLDRDGDGRLTIIFSNNTSNGIQGDVVGWFDYRDFLPNSSARATGNEADILWSRVPGSGDTTMAAAVGTLAHEFAHLFSYGVRVEASGEAARREVLWLDEGIAHLMEDLTGWGDSNVPNVAVALENWEDGHFATTTDSNEQRGQAYLLLRYLVDQQASGASAANASSVESAATSIVSTLISEESLGFDHSLFTNTGASGLASWLQAIHVSGNSDVLSSSQTETYLPTGAHAETGQTQGFNGYAERDEASGSSIELEGPSSEDIDDFSSGFSGEVYQSGSAYFLISAGDTESLTLTGKADAAYDIRMHAWQVE